ncbi:MAG: hypothetical protein AAFQ65_12175 [Myxococcota bacterium]
MGRLSKRATGLAEHIKWARGVRWWRPSPVVRALAVPVALTACQTAFEPTCPPEATLRDGVCTAVELRCADEGVVLRDLECVAEATACGPNLQRTEDGRCILTESVCAPPLEFDQERQACAPPLGCGAGTERVGDVCVSSCAGLFELPGNLSGSCVPAARLQFVNAHRSAELAAVDVWITSVSAGSPNGMRVAQALGFREATPALKLPLDAAVRITEANAADASAPLLETASGVFFPDEGRLVVVQTNVPQTGGPSGPIAFGFHALREAPSVSSEGVELAFVHAAFEAGDLAFGLQSEFSLVPPDELMLVNDLAYGESSGYVSAAGTILEAERTVAFDVFSGGGTQGLARIVRNSFQSSAGSLVPAESGPPVGTAAVLVAVSTEERVLIDGASNVELLWVAPDGGAVPVDRASRLQLVHAGAPPNDGMIDVFALRDGANAFEEPSLGENVSYQQARAFQTFPSGVPMSVRAFRPGPTAPAIDDSTLVTLAVANGLPAGRQRLIAIADPDDGTRLSLVTADAGPREVDTGFGADFVHAALSIASSVDVHISTFFVDINARDLESAEISGLIYGSGQSVAMDSEALSVFNDNIVAFTLPGGTRLEDVVADFSTLLGSSGFTNEGDGLAFVATDAAVAAGEQELTIVRADGATRVVGLF